jgi:hypothetical protein
MQSDVPGLTTGHVCSVSHSFNSGKMWVPWKNIRNVSTTLWAIKRQWYVCTVNSTSDYTLSTFYRSYFNGISANIKLKVYNVLCCWPYVRSSHIYLSTFVYLWLSCKGLVLVPQGLIVFSGSAYTRFPYKTRVTPKRRSYTLMRTTNIISLWFFLVWHVYRINYLNPAYLY